MVLIYGQTLDCVLAEGQPVDENVVNRIFRDSEEFNPFLGRVSRDEIEKLLKDRTIVQELNRRFAKECLPVGAETTIPLLCSKAVIAIGVGAGKNAESLIFRFLNETNRSNRSARKAGLLALGYLENTRKQQRSESQQPSHAVLPGDINTNPPTASPRLDLASKLPPSNISQEIIKCLPQAMRQNFNFTGSDFGKTFKLCESPWDVREPTNRDEIRWGLMSLAETGSEEAKEVLGNLKRDPVGGPSRQAFIKNLLRIYQKASEGK